MKNFALLAPTMPRIQQIATDFLLLDNSQMGIGKLHVPSSASSNQSKYSTDSFHLIANSLLMLLMHQLNIQINSGVKSA
jgi:hypothetical protein